MSTRELNYEAPSEAALEPESADHDPRHHFWDTRNWALLLPELLPRQLRDAQPDEA